jgi:hypothetical protein
MRSEKTASSRMRIDLGAGELLCSLTDLIPVCSSFPGTLHGVSERPCRGRIGNEAGGRSLIHSRFPPTSVTTEGLPQIIASTRVTGVPSDREGQIETMSRTCPQNSTLSESL